MNKTTREQINKTLADYEYSINLGLGLEEKVTALSVNFMKLLTILSEQPEKTQEQIKDELSKAVMIDPKDNIYHTEQVSEQTARDDQFIIDIGCLLKILDRYVEPYEDESGNMVIKIPLQKWVSTGSLLYDYERYINQPQPIPCIDYKQMWEILKRKLEECYRDYNGYNEGAFTSERGVLNDVLTDMKALEHPTEDDEIGTYEKMPTHSQFGKNYNLSTEDDTKLDNICTKCGKTVTEGDPGLCIDCVTLRPYPELENEALEKARENTYKKYLLDYKSDKFEFVSADSLIKQKVAYEQAIKQLQQRADKDEKVIDDFVVILKQEIKEAFNIDEKIYYEILLDKILELKEV